MPLKLTPDIINAAIAGFEAQKQQIDSQIAELKGMLDGTRPEATTPTAKATRGRRKMSPAARARIAEAQRKRWAATKHQTEAAKPATPEPAKPKRKRRMSKEGRARIIAATKARWARVRAERAQAETPAKTPARKSASRVAKRKSATKRPQTAPASTTATET